MPSPNRFEESERRFYVLARAYCRNGTVNGSKEQRLTCALVELRDRLAEEFLKVSKSWQVSAEELRRCYSYAYPNSAAGAPDPFCLEQACEGVMIDLRSAIQNYAKQYAVPDDLLEKMVTDWLVSDAMCSERTPSAFFIPEMEVAREDEADKLPSVMDLVRARPRGGESGDGGAEGRGEQAAGG